MDEKTAEICKMLMNHRIHGSGNGHVQFSGIRMICLEVKSKCHAVWQCIDVEILRQTYL